MSETGEQLLVPAVHTFSSNFSFVAASFSPAVLYSSQPDLQKHEATWDTNRGVNSHGKCSVRLDEGKVIGAALDVLEKEKFDKLSPEQKQSFEDLFTRKNVVLSPHVGGWTFASYKRINEVLVGKIATHYQIDSTF